MIFMVSVSLIFQAQNTIAQTLAPYAPITYPFTVRLPRITRTSYPCIPPVLDTISGKLSLRKRRLLLAIAMTCCIIQATAHLNRFRRLKKKLICRPMRLSVNCSRGYQTQIGKRLSTTPSEKSVLRF